MTAGSMRPELSAGNEATSSGRLRLMAIQSAPVGKSRQ
jgi:hypothetical protein